MMLDKERELGVYFRARVSIRRKSFGYQFMKDEYVGVSLRKYYVRGFFS